MQISDIPFGTTDWSQVERTEHKGARGVAYWRTPQFGAVRVRMVEYTPGYVADHWCVKGHILLCTEGELHTELKDGRKFTLKALAASFAFRSKARKSDGCLTRTDVGILLTALAPRACLTVDV